MRFQQTHNQVCVRCCQQCPGTSAPTAAHLTVSPFLCSSGSNAQGKGPWKGFVSVQKSPSRVQDRDEGVAGRKGKEKYFLNEGSLICPPGKSTIFYKKETEKIELVARPEINDQQWAEIIKSDQRLMTKRTLEFDP